jgi:hypothetical protein
MAGVWGYRYQYPADCVAVRKIQNPNAPPADAIPLDIETSIDGQTKSILTNQEDAVLVYTWNIKNTDMFTSAFVDALSHLLASRIAFSITGKRKIAREELATYLGLLPQATGENANEGVRPPPREAESIRARE